MSIARLHFCVRLAAVLISYGMANSSNADALLWNPLHCAQDKANYEVTNDHGQVWLKDASCFVETDQGVFELSDKRYQRTVCEIMASDFFCSQPWQVIDANDTLGVLNLKLMLSTDGDGRLLVKLRCVNRSAKPMRLLRICVLEGIRSGDWKGGSLLQFGDYYMGGRQLLKDQQTTVAPLFMAVNRPALTAGFLSSSHYLSYISLTPQAAGLKLEAWHDGEKVLLPAGSQRESEILWLSCRQRPSSEVENWATIVGLYNNARIPARNFATWCSWYSGSVPAGEPNHYGKLEKMTQANIPIIAKKFQPLGFDCMRAVEDSACRKAGDWPLFTEELPNGYVSLGQEMKKAGIRPGFWYDVHRVSDKSAVFKQHPGWLAHVEGNDVQPFTLVTYGLCGYVDASTKGGYDFFKQAARKFTDIGYEYCFTDYLFECAIMPARSHDETMTGAEVARRAHAALREGFGPDFYWLSQNMYFANIGLVDSMRVGEDGHGVEIDTYRQALTWWFANRKFFLCDADAWLPLDHDLAWDRAWGSWLFLTGYASTIGGDLRKLTPEREKMIQRLLPPLNQTGCPRDLWERRVPAVLEQDCKAGGDHWRVVGLFNWQPFASNVRLNLDRLWDESVYPEQGFAASAGVLPQTNRSYLIYDYWDEKFIGEFTAEAGADLPEKCGYRVWVIRESLSHPQLLSVGDHIGQGLEELIRCDWNDKKQQLTGTTRGRRGVFDTVVRIHVPAGWEVNSVQAGGSTLSFDEPQKQVCRFTVPDKQGPVSWAVSFKGNPSVAASSMRPLNPALMAQVSFAPDKVAQYRKKQTLFQQKVIEKLDKKAIEPGWQLVHMARPTGSTLSEYDPQLSLGLVQGREMFWWDFRLTTIKQWYDPECIVYRIDKLDPNLTYKLGLLLFSPDVEPRTVPGAGDFMVRLPLVLPVRDPYPYKVDIVVANADGKETVVRKDWAVARMEKGKRPGVLWVDLPYRSVDSRGLIVKVRKTFGPSVCVSEIWLISRETSSKSDEKTK